jgi:hypothetical protein
MTAIDLDIGVYNMRICIINNISYDVYFIYKCNKYAIYNKHEVCGWRLKIKPNSVRIRLEVSNFCSSLDGIWTHTIDTLSTIRLALRPTP